MIVWVLPGSISRMGAEGVMVVPVPSYERSLPPLPHVRLVWRCLECGYVGVLPEELENLPEACPDCGAPKTEFEVVRED